MFQLTPRTVRNVCPRLSIAYAARASLGTRIGNGLFLIFIDRFDSWQIGCVIPKGCVGYHAHPDVLNAPFVT